MEVGVRKFKAKLSSYLARAAAGEVVTVTDRGQPVAVLSPPPGAVDLEAASATSTPAHCSSATWRSLTRRAQTSCSPPTAPSSQAGTRWSRCAGTLPASFRRLRPHGHAPRSPVTWPPCH